MKTNVFRLWLQTHLYPIFLKLIRSSDIRSPQSACQIPHDRQLIIALCTLRFGMYLKPLNRKLVKTYDLTYTTYMDALFIKTMESTIVLRSASSQTNGILPITVLIHFLLELKRQMRITAFRDDWLRILLSTAYATFLPVSSSSSLQLPILFPFSLSPLLDLSLSFLPP